VRLMFDGEIHTHDHRSSVGLRSQSPHGEIVYDGGNEGLASSPRRRSKDQPLDDSSVEGQNRLHAPIHEPMTAEQSSASPEAVSSTFGHPEESEDIGTVPVLREIRINTPSLRLDASAVVDTTAGDEVKGRALYRLAFAILLLAIGLLLDARRLVDAASILLR